jgi:hypothetical protein
LDREVAASLRSDAFEALAAQVTAMDCVRAQMGGTDAGSGRAREVSSELERRSGRRAEGLQMIAPVRLRAMLVRVPISLAFEVNVTDDQVAFLW